MNIGKRIKDLYGKVNSVDYVTFDETTDHIVAIIHTYDGKISHKQVNDVLNQYPLGHWIFVDSRIAQREKHSFVFNKEITFTLSENYLLSVYRVDKQTALNALAEKEKR